MVGRLLVVSFEVSAGIFLANSSIKICTSCKLISFLFLLFKRNKTNNFPSSCPSITGCAFCRKLFVSIVTSMQDYYQHSVSLRKPFYFTISMPLRVCWNVGVVVKYITLLDAELKPRRKWLLIKFKYFSSLFYPFILYGMVDESMLNWTTGIYVNSNMLGVRERRTMKKLVYLLRVPEAGNIM